MNTNIADIRKDYIKNELSKKNTSNDPIAQFKKWFDEALKSDVAEVNAMTLSTVTKYNRPTGRIVLLKGIEDNRFVFYTNYQSDKGKELDNNPFAGLTFFWNELERQVRIDGKVERVAPEVSTAYFQSRPRESQIGAYTSPQSTPIANRQVLEERFTKLTKEFEGKETIERPMQWGGYAVIPDRIEFWQGRPSRLHDRVLYTLNDKGDWDKVRLAP